MYYNTILSKNTENLKIN